MSTSLTGVQQLGGRTLSFNNLNDLAGARRLADELDGPACVIVKHANPCGAAVADTIEDAYAKALASDPVSAYGGIVVLNRPVEQRLAERLAAQFVEVLLAPAFSEEALALLREKEALRILAGGEPLAAAAATTSASPVASSSRTPTPRPTSGRRWRS